MRRPVPRHPGKRPRAFADHLTAVVVGVLLGPAVAAAQPEANAVAEALFQQGRDLVKQERYAEACPKLAESQRLEPRLGTLLNLAVCHEKQGKTATAWAEYASAAAVARREGQKEREDFAREQEAALAKKIPRIVLQGSVAQAGISITLDDERLANAVLGTPLPIDPGKHRIAASAPAKKTWSQEIDVPPERAEITVPIPVLEAAPAPPPPPSAPAPASSPPPAVVPPPIAPVPAPAPAPPPSNDATIVMATGFAVGGAGILVGAVTGAITLANASSIRGNCHDNQCGADQKGPIASATTIANVSNVAFGIGAAGAVVGVVGLLLRPKAPSARTGVTLTPIVGRGVAGLRGSF